MHLFYKKRYFESPGKQSESIVDISIAHVITHTWQEQFKKDVLAIYTTYYSFKNQKHVLKHITIFAVCLLNWK